MPLCSTAVAIGLKNPNVAPARISEFMPTVALKFVFISLIVLFATSFATATEPMSSFSRLMSAVAFAMSAPFYILMPT